MAGGQFGAELLEWIYERRLVPSNIGRATHRRVPVGMPRLRTDLLNCTIYLYALDAEGNPLGEPDGTGSIICRQGPSGLKHYYAVSNWHLTNDPGTVEAPGVFATVIRLNTKDGKARWLTYGPTDWHFIAGGHDVSVADITDDLDDVTDQFFAIPEELFITVDVHFKYQIGPGDDVLMLGMFANQFGRERNIPAVRFGNIALDALFENPIPLENNTDQPSHLADMRSRSGFSGSPVFVFRNHIMDLSHPFHWRRNLSWNEDFGFSTGKHPSTPKDTLIGFLGVHVGQYWDRVKFRRLNPQARTVEKVGDTIREGDELEVQSGMTVIAPAWHVTETLDLEVFRMSREKREALKTAQSKRAFQPERKSPRAAEAQAESDDASPDHKERFTSLLNAAATRKTPTDQT